jgi:hypothetical protein
MKGPSIKGDPAVNGIACDEFVTYKNVSDGFTKEEKKAVAKKIIGKTLKEESDDTIAALGVAILTEKTNDLGEVPTF